MDDAEFEEMMEELRSAREEARESLGHDYDISCLGIAGPEPKCDSSYDGRWDVFGDE